MRFNTVTQGVAQMYSKTRIKKMNDKIIELEKANSELKSKNMELKKEIENIKNKISSKQEG